MKPCISVEGTIQVVLPRARPGPAGGIFCLAWPWLGLTFLSEVGPWPGLQLARLAGPNQARLGILQAWPWPACGLIKYKVKIFLHRNIIYIDILI